jgi:secreted trypsin-like serine protease
VEYMKKKHRTLAPLFVVLVVATALNSGAALPALATDDTEYQAQIVGGTNVPNGEYPFMASLQERKNNQPPAKEHFCSGTLIDPDSVLTAAHCAIDIKREVPAGKLRVVIGPTVLSSDQGQARGISSLSDISVHPRYNGVNSVAYDAAVIELDRSVSFDPIELATAASQDRLEKPGRKVRIAGWGNTIKQTPPFNLEPDSHPNRMRAAPVPLVSDARAKDIYGSSYVPRLMVAAGKEGKGACQGDSGGPMLTSTPKEPRQIGIISFGTGCGAQGYPVVYAEVNATSISNFITNAASK